MVSFKKSMDLNIHQNDGINIKNKMDMQQKKN